MSNKFPIIAIVLTAVLVVAGAFFFSSKDTAVILPPTHEYYWKETCPYCANVQEFLDSWDKTDKLQLDKKDVTQTQNAVLLNKRADYCRIPRASIGVPFLFTPEGKCLSGDVPIIEYLKNLEL